MPIVPFVAIFQEKDIFKVSNEKRLIHICTERSY